MTSGMKKLIALNLVLIAIAAVALFLAIKPRQGMVAMTELRTETAETLVAPLIAIPAVPEAQAVASPTPAPVAAVAVVATKPVASAKPVLTADVSYIGNVEVGGTSKIALYDVEREASFVVMPGESWADWYCVSRSSDNIVLKKNERLFYVRCEN